MTDRESRLRGVILMVVAVGVFSVMDALMKHLAASYPPMQIAFLRGASSLPFVFLSYAVTGRLAELRPRSIPMHLTRAVLSILMLWCFVWALARMSMANTYAITLSAPLLVVPFAVLFLREKADGHTWAAILAGLAGVLVILKPTVSGFVSLAGLAALAAALCWAIVVVMLRVMAASETTASMVFWFLLLTAVGAGAAGGAWLDCHRRARLDLDRRCSGLRAGRASTSSPRRFASRPHRRSRLSSTCRSSGAPASTGSCGRRCRARECSPARQSSSPRAST